MSGFLVSVQSDSFTRLCFRVFSGRVKCSFPSVSHRRRGSVTQAQRVAYGLNLSAAARHFNSQLRGLLVQLIGVSFGRCGGFERAFDASPFPMERASSASGEQLYGILVQGL